MTETTHIIPAVRLKQIEELLAEKGSVQVDEIVAACKVSKATARRDLDKLAKTGVLIRTHGGAITNAKTALDLPHSEKQGLYIEEKLRIAKKAAEYIEDGNSIFLDSGTTCLAIAKELVAKHNLTIISNNTNIIHTVEFHPSTTVVSTGGIKRQNYNVLTGSITENFIRTLQVDVAFIGADAVNIHSGIYVSAISEIGLKQTIINCGRRSALVVDSSKFRSVGMVRECGLDSVDIIITDSGLTDRERTALARSTRAQIDIV